MRSRVPIIVWLTPSRNTEIGIYRPPPSNFFSYIYLLHTEKKDRRGTDFYTYICRGIKKGTKERNMKERSRGKHVSGSITLPLNHSKSYLFPIDGSQTTPFKGIEKGGWCL